MTCYLIDLDGTLLVDSHAVNEAAEFIGALNQRGEEYLLLTNGSANSPEVLSRMLCDEGIEIQKERIITVAEVTAEYLKKYYEQKRICCIGSLWLQLCLEEAGIEISDGDADVVVVGYDENISMGRLNHAIDLILNGAIYVSTNDDLWIPSGEAVKPHTGCINEILRQATGKKAILLGKPEKYFMEIIRQRTNAEIFCMIGDSIKTDGLFGIRNNMKVYLIGSRVTEREQKECHACIQKVRDLRAIIEMAENPK